MRELFIAEEIASQARNDGLATVRSMVHYSLRSAVMSIWPIRKPAKLPTFRQRLLLYASTSSAVEMWRT